MGYLPYSKVAHFFTENNVNLLWWSVRSIENNPTEEGLCRCIDFLKHPDFRIRFVSLFVLETLKIDVPSSVLESLFQEEKHPLVDNEALWFLKSIGKIDLLKSFAKSGVYFRKYPSRN